METLGNMNLQLGEAVRIVMKTTPYIAYRALIYGAICLATIAYLGVLGVIGLVFGAGAFWVLLIATMGLGWVLGVGRLLGAYVLYLLKAGHVALITEIATKGDLPTGISQTAWAKERVMDYFKEISVLAFIDQIVQAIIRVVNRRLVNVASAIPIPGLEGAAKVANRIVDFSLKFIDESVIAHTFRTESDNVYDAARSGILLYCQSWKALLYNAVALTVLSYVFAIAAAVVFMIPLGIIAWMIEAQAIRFALFAIAVFMGISLKWILFDPVASTSTILTFLKETEGKEPDPEWEARIESVSNQFATLKQRAAEHWGAPPGASPDDGEPVDENLN